MIYDIFVNCIWVVARWQQYSTHLHTNSTQNDTKQTIHRTTQQFVGKQMKRETKLRIHNITAKAALKFGSEAMVLKKRQKQRLEAAQMEFLRHLLGITKLVKEKNQCIRGKNGSTEHSKGNKTVP